MKKLEQKVRGIDKLESKIKAKIRANKKKCPGCGATVSLLAKFQGRIGAFITRNQDFDRILVQTRCRRCGHPILWLPSEESEVIRD